MIFKYLSIVTISVILIGCTSKPNIDIIKKEIDTPQIIRSVTIYKPKIDWNVSSDKKSVYVTYDEFVELLKFMSSVSSYRRETEDMLCYYKNVEACKRVENRCK
jgi:hypothetical protein